MGQKRTLLYFDNIGVILYDSVPLHWITHIKMAQTYWLKRERVKLSNITEWFSQLRAEGLLRVLFVMSHTVTWSAWCDIVILNDWLTTQVIIIVLNIFKIIYVAQYSIYCCKHFYTIQLCHKCYFTFLSLEFYTEGHFDTLELNNSLNFILWHTHTWKKG